MPFLSMLGQRIVFTSVSMLFLPKANGQSLGVLSSTPMYTLTETHSETLPDAGVLEATSEACYTLLAFGAAVAAIQLLKQRNHQTKVTRDAARKVTALGIQIPSTPLTGSASPTPKMPNVASVSTVDNRRSGGNGTREPKMSCRVQSGSGRDADKLVAAVRAGRAADLPLLMDAARMRLVDAGAEKETIEAAAVQNLMSVLRACAAHHHFAQALVAFDHAKGHINVGSGSMWSLLLYSSVEAKQYSRCEDFFKKLLSLAVPSPNDLLNMVRYHAHQQDAEGLKNTLADLRGVKFQFDTISRNRALSVCFASRGERLADILMNNEYFQVDMDIVGYNTVLKGYAKLGDFSRCFQIYEVMQNSGLPSTEVTFGILLDVCIEAKAFDRAKQVFGSLRDSGMKLNVVHYTTFMKGLVSAGQLEEATNLLDEMIASPDTKPDLVTYSTLVKAHADSGQVMEAVRVLERMVAQDSAPDAIILNSVLTGCTVKIMEPEQVFHVFKWLVNHGLQTSTTTLSILLKAFAKSESWIPALDLLKTAPQRLNIWPEPRLYAQLAQAASKAGNGAAAIETYKLMVKAAAAQGVAVDEATNTRLLRHCTTCGESALATKIHRAVAHAGGCPTINVMNF